MLSYLTCKQKGISRAKGSKYDICIFALMKETILSTRVLINILFTSGLILLFFYLNFHIFKFESTLLGAIMELLIIPSVLGILLATIIGVINWIREGFAMNTGSVIVAFLGIVLLGVLTVSI